MGNGKAFGKEMQSRWIERLATNKEFVKEMNIRNEDYKNILNEAEEGDLVCLDPPYDSTDFYTNNVNQQEVCCEVDKLTVKNVKFILFNSDTPYVRELYDGYKILTVIGKSSVFGNTTQLVVILNFGDENAVCSRGFGRSFTGPTRTSDAADDRDLMLRFIKLKE